MTDLKKYFEASKTLKNQKPLFTRSELTDQIEHGKPKIKLKNNFKWRLIMSLSGIILISMASFFTFFNGAVETIIEKTDQKKETTLIDSKTKQGNNLKHQSQKISNDKQLKEQKTVKQNDKEETTNDIIFSRGKLINGKIDQNAPEPELVKKDNILSEMDIAGITMIELNHEEMKKLDIKFDENELIMYKERLVEELRSKFQTELLKSKGYNVKNLPFFVRKYSIYSKNRMKYDTSMIVPYSGWSINDYSKTLHVAIHRLSSKNRITMWGVYRSPLLKYGIQSYQDYYQFEINWMKEHNKLFMKDRELFKKQSHQHLEILRKAEKKVLEHLVPLYFEWQGKDFVQKYIFWYVPTKEFLEAIPERYSKPLKRELEAIRLHDELGIPLNEACKGIEDSKSIYEFCRLASGSLEIKNVSPNPGNEKVVCEFEITQPRIISINIHDLNGRFLGNIIKNKSYKSGVHSVEMDLSKYEKSQFYLLSISTDKGESAAKRLILQ